MTPEHGSILVLNTGWCSLPGQLNADDVLSPTRSERSTTFSVSACSFPLQGFATRRPNKQCQPSSHLAALSSSMMRLSRWLMPDGEILAADIVPDPAYTFHENGLASNHLRSDIYPTTEFLRNFLNVTIILTGTYINVDCS